MKITVATSIILGVLSAALASYTFILQQELSTKLSNPSGESPRELIIDYLGRTRWDGTGNFFTQHIDEIKRNLSIENSFDKSGVSLALVSTEASGKKLKLCVWMKQNENGWELIPYLSEYSDSPFTKKWIEVNQSWLSEMSEKKEEWESQSQSVW